MGNTNSKTKSPFKRSSGPSIKRSEWTEEHHVIQDKEHRTCPPPIPIARGSRSWRSRRRKEKRRQRGVLRRVRRSGGYGPHYFPAGPATTQKPGAKTGTYRKPTERVLNDVLKAAFAILLEGNEQLVPKLKVVDLSFVQEEIKGHPVCQETEEVRSALEACRKELAIKTREVDDLKLALKASEEACTQVRDRSATAEEFLTRGLLALRGRGTNAEEIGDSESVSQQVTHRLAQPVSKDMVVAAATQTRTGAETAMHGHDSRRPERLHDMFSISSQDQDVRPLAMQFPGANDRHLDAHGKPSLVSTPVLDVVSHDFDVYSASHLTAAEDSLEECGDKAGCAQQATDTVRLTGVPVTICTSTTLPPTNVDAQERQQTGGSSRVDAEQRDCSCAPHCDWRGAVLNYAAHEKECRYSCCDNAKHDCKVILERQDMAAHLQTCSRNNTPLPLPSPHAEHQTESQPGSVEPQVEVELQQGREQPIGSTQDLQVQLVPISMKTAQASVKEADLKHIPGLSMLDTGGELIAGGEEQITTTPDPVGMKLGKAAYIHPLAKVPVGAFISRADQDATLYPALEMHAEPDGPAMIPPVEAKQQMHQTAQQQIQEQGKENFAKPLCRRKELVMVPEEVAECWMQFDGNLPWSSCSKKSDTGLADVDLEAKDSARCGKSIQIHLGQSDTTARLSSAEESSQLASDLDLDSSSRPNSQMPDSDSLKGVANEMPAVDTGSSDVRPLADLEENATKEQMSDPETMDVPLESQDTNAHTKGGLSIMQPSEDEPRQPVGSSSTATGNAIAKPSDAGKEEAGQKSNRDTPPIQEFKRLTADLVSGLMNCTEQSAADGNVHLTPPATSRSGYRTNRCSSCSDSESDFDKDSCDGRRFPRLRNTSWRGNEEGLCVRVEHHSANNKRTLLQMRISTDNLPTLPSGVPADESFTKARSTELDHPEEEQAQSMAAYVSPNVRRQTLLRLPPVDGREYFKDCDWYKLINTNRTALAKHLFAVLQHHASELIKIIPSKRAARWLQQLGMIRKCTELCLKKESKQKCHLFVCETFLSEVVPQLDGDGVIALVVKVLPGLIEEHYLATFRYCLGDDCTLERLH